MDILGWEKEESPFHQGEQAVQSRLGVRDRMEAVGQRMIRQFMPEQHRQFYAQLPYILVGSVDKDGNPWTSILVGEPGFISAPSDRSLHIAAQPPFGDPLAKNLIINGKVGCLGIELHTRRRNRINGVVDKIAPDGFFVEVEQTFGNCPKYIQARQCSLKAFDNSVPRPVHTFTILDDVTRSMITTVDTFFITTAYLDNTTDVTHGVDVSHRGGKPGFVRIDGDTLTVPDFTGNYIFNTFGNIEANPRAGLLFIDFEQGSLLYLTGRAEVIWDGDPEVELYSGAQRLFRFYLGQGVYVEGNLPLSWSSLEQSTALKNTGPWKKG